MNLTNKEKNAVTVKWGQHDINLSSLEIPYFFEELTNLDIHCLADLEFEIQEITDFAIQGAPDELLVTCIKNKVKLLRLIYTTINASVEIKL